MKQLRNFNSNNFNHSNNSNNQSNSNNTGSQNPNDAMKKYSNMDEDTLINELVKMIEAQKANGTFNPAQLQSYSQMLAPHLSKTQKLKLDNIMKIIALENE